MNTLDDYLGDGVYARFDGHHTVLYTLGGSVIFLEDAVLLALDRYKKRVREYYAKRNPESPAIISCEETTD